MKTYECGCCGGVHEIKPVRRIFRRYTKEQKMDIIVKKHKDCFYARKYNTSISNISNLRTEWKKQMGITVTKRGDSYSIVPRKETKYRVEPAD